MNATGEDRQPRRVLSEVQLQESDESAVCLGNKNDRGAGPLLEERARLLVVIGEGAWPQGMA